jgi:hypothetical protein
MHKCDEDGRFTVGVTGSREWLTPVILILPLVEQDQMPPRTALIAMHM